MAWKYEKYDNQWGSSWNEISYAHAGNKRRINAMRHILGTAS